MTSEQAIEIRGGAGPQAAAAVVAVIELVLEEEEAMRARRPARAVPPAWVRTGQTVPAGRFTSPVVPDPGLNWPV